MLIDTLPKNIWVISSNKQQNIVTTRDEARKIKSYFKVMGDTHINMKRIKVTLSDPEPTS